MTALCQKQTKHSARYLLISFSFGEFNSRTELVWFVNKSFRLVLWIESSKSFQIGDLKINSSSHHNLSAYWFDYLMHSGKIVCSGLFFTQSGCITSYIFYNAFNCPFYLFFFHFLIAPALILASGHNLPNWPLVLHRGMKVKFGKTWGCFFLEKFPIPLKDLPLL